MGVSFSGSFLFGPHLNAGATWSPLRAFANPVGFLLSAEVVVLGWDRRPLLRLQVSGLSKEPRDPCSHHHDWRPAPAQVGPSSGVCFGANWEKACTHCWAGRSALECPARQLSSGLLVGSWVPSGPCISVVHRWSGCHSDSFITPATRVVFFKHRPCCFPAY